MMDTGFSRTDMAFDTLVVAAGMKAQEELFHQADQRFRNVHRIGDCLKVRNIQGAIWDAYEVMRRL